MYQTSHGTAQLLLRQPRMAMEPTQVFYSLIHYGSLIATTIGAQWQLLIL